MNENKNNEVILIGLPNSGKSTLINTLSKNKTSIVGSKPNTTRDKVSQKINIHDKEIILSDLPGLDDNPDFLNNEFQKKVIQKHNLDKDELEFLRLNLIYSSKCQSKKLFSKGFKVGTPEYKECIMRKGKISD